MFQCRAKWMPGWLRLVDWLAPFWQCMGGYNESVTALRWLGLLSRIKRAAALQCGWHRNQRIAAMKARLLPSGSERVAAVKPWLTTSLQWEYGPSKKCPPHTLVRGLRRERGHHPLPLGGTSCHVTLLSSSSTVNSSSTVSSSSHPKRRVGPRRRPPQCRPRGPDIHEGLDPELLVEERTLSWGWGFVLAKLRKEHTNVPSVS